MILPLFYIFVSPSVNLEHRFYLEPRKWEWTSELEGAWVFKEFVDQLYIKNLFKFIWGQCFVFQLSHPYFRFFSIVYSQTKSYLIMRFCAANVRLFEYIYKLMYFNWNSMKDRSVMNYRVYKIEVKQGKVYNIENSGKKHIRSKWFSVWTVWKLSCSPDNLNM